MYFRRRKGYGSDGGRGLNSYKEGSFLIIEEGGGLWEEEEGARFRVDNSEKERGRLNRERRPRLVGREWRMLVEGAK